MQPFNRIKVWTEQKQISIPSLFFQTYKHIAISDEEALLILQILTFQEEGNDFPTPNMMASRTHFDENKVSSMYQRLIQKGIIELLQQTNVDGLIYETFSLYPLWDKILSKIEQQHLVHSAATVKIDDRTIFNLLEQELGRLLSSIEIEQVGMWMDHDGHSPEVIKEAIKEAVLAGKMSLRYIDRILFEWKKKQLKTLDQIRAHAEQFRNHSIASKPHNQAQQPQVNTQPKSGFYNWLDERE